jgi:phage shock protein E
MNVQLTKLLLISSIIALSYSPIHAAELSNDPLPTVQENVATHKAVLVDVREPGEWKQGHVEGAISVPLSSLNKQVDTGALEHQLPKDKSYTHTASWEYVLSKLRRFWRSLAITSGLSKLDMKAW